VRLSVRFDEEGGIEPQQVEASRDFMKRTGEYMGKAEKAILKYYRSVCDDYRGIMRIEAGDDERMANWRGWSRWRASTSTTCATSRPAGCCASAPGGRNTGWAC
jgi:hypothetical protein